MKLLGEKKVNGKKVNRHKITYPKKKKKSVKEKKHYEALTEKKQNQY